MSKDSDDAIELGLRKHRDIDAVTDSPILKLKDLKSESFRRSFHSGRVHDLDEDSLVEKEFQPSTGLSTAEVEARLKIYGRNELVEKSKTKLQIFIEQFTAPMPIMIWIAIITEAILNDWASMWVLCALQAINGGVGFYEMSKAGDAIAALKASLKPKAIAKRDGKWIEVHAGTLVPGDLVSLTAGAAVPADCIINEGTVDVDQSALTGESLPVTMVKGDSPKMGSTVARGETEATVDQTGMNTFFGKTANMIQSVDELGHLQKVLLTIMGGLIILSFALCGITLWYLLDQGQKVKESLSFVVVLLVASIPVAMEVVVTATMALGSRELARMDAIVARLSAIEELAGMNMLCSDKTGTLTLNKMVIQDDCPTFNRDTSREDVILFAALAAKWWEPAKDALDTMVLGAVDIDKCNPYKQLEYMPFDPTKKRTEATLQGPDGRTFKVTKGAPQIVLELCHDKNTIKDMVDGKVLELAEKGIRSLAVATTNDAGQWYLMGILTFLDPPRPDTKETVRRARMHGVEVKMVTGDHRVIAKETARVLEMGTNILGCEGLPNLGEDGKIPKGAGMDELCKKILDCNGFAQVFPEHKFIIVEALRQQGFAVGMTGDGVNDAPALKKADIGIAVQGATDAARAAADIVLTQPGLSVIVEAIIISRMIFARMKSFIVYRVACTLQLLVFFFIGVLWQHPREYHPDDLDFPLFWRMPVVALIMITVLNDGTIISIAYDNVQSSKNPEVWNLRAVSVVSTVLGMVACVSSVILLHWALDSKNPTSLFHKMGVDLEFGEVMAVMYLKVSLSDFLTLFASRTHGMFYVQTPGKLLAAAFCFAVGTSTIFSLTWPFGEGMSALPSIAALSVWIYCLVWFVIQDVCKTVLYWWMHKYNILGINNSRSVVQQHHRGEYADADKEHGGYGATKVSQKSTRTSKPSEKQALLGK
jgi:H+-transporting ATPase